MAPSHACITTVQELSPELRVATVVKLQRLAGEDVEVSFEVDPAIVGGMIVDLDGQVTDMSLAGGFREYGHLVQTLISDQLQALEQWTQAQAQQTEEPVNTAVQVQPVRLVAPHIPDGLNM